MNFRTDLALERRQMLGENLSGVKVREIQGEETKTTVIDIVDKDAAQKLGKGIGRYITIEMKSFSDDAAASGGRLEALTKSIASLLPKGDGVVLVAGVGNMSMTSDALGPRTSSMIFATRHIGDEMRKAAGFSHKLRPVATVSSGVLGQTGIESGEYIKSICGVVKPSCVITIDALAAGSVSRLGNTVQMSDTGISPGSGIGNSRLRIDEGFLGVPVIAIGVPTVVDSVCLACELLGKDINEIPDEISEKSGNLIVAPKDVDLLVKNASFLIALAINCALQPELTPEELYALM